MCGPCRDRSVPSWVTSRSKRPRQASGDGSEGVPYRCSYLYPDAQCPERHPWPATSSGKDGSVARRGAATGVALGGGEDVGMARWVEGDSLASCSVSKPRIPSKPSSSSLTDACFLFRQPFQALRMATPSSRANSPSLLRGPPRTDRKRQ